MRRLMLLPLLLLGCASDGARDGGGSGADAPGGPGVREFHAFDNGLTRIEGLEEKAALLRELGYDGICWRTGAGSDEMIGVLDRHGLRMASTYVGCRVDADRPSFDERLPAEMEGYRRHETIIWLSVARGTDASDDIAVRLIREVAALAGEAGLEVVLYPHSGFYVETVEDALRLTKEVDRPNVGMSFNLCHFLKTDDEENLEAVLKKAAPHLMLVSINGADSGETGKMGWDRLIQPLGDGTCDTGRVLEILDEIGYRGPVGLQCYAIEGDDRENLKKSITAWRALSRSGYQ